MKQSESKCKVFSEVISEITQIKGIKMYGRRKSSIILDLYIKKIQDTLLAGYEWEIPGLGTLCIFKNELDRDQLPNISIVETLKNKKRTISYNPKRMGFFYTIELKSNVLNESGMLFKASASLRERLTGILMNSNQEYRSKV